VSLAILVIYSFSGLFASTLPHPADDGNKFVLSRFRLKNEKIGHLTSDISNLIFSKKNGFRWPVTKIIFSKDNNDSDILKLDITAIDNEWNKIIEPGEKPCGYFIISNRLFVISTKEGSPVDLAQYFDPVEDGERIFSNTECSTLIKNPKWIYQCDNTSMFARQLHTSNIEALGR
jgi:hypothetical protein